MDLARRALSLPFPITWLEWQNAECGLSGSRYGALIQAELGDDLQGKAQVLVIGFPDPWRPTVQPFNSVPFAEFLLELGQTGMPFLSLKDFTPGFEVRDTDKFGRFLQAVLTFITQPRMCRLSTPSIPSNQAVLERARREGGWRPLNSRVHEVHLVLDMPEEARDKEGGAVLGSGNSGKALHTVRAFWRWKLGKLEFVRPHWRGDAQFGVSPQNLQTYFSGRVVAQGFQLRNYAMPKPSQPSPRPPKGDEDPVWGDLFGFVARPPPAASMADTPTSAPPHQQPNKPAKPKKPSTKRVLPGRAGNP